MRRPNLFCLRAFSIAFLISAGTIILSSSTLFAQSSDKKIEVDKTSAQKMLLEHYSSKLKKQGVGTTPDAIRTYLGKLAPDEKTIVQLKKLIAQLGDDDANVREKATTALLNAPALPLELLSQSSKERDPEIRGRVKQIQEARDSKTKDVLFAIYQVIHLQKMKGQTKGVLTSFNYCQNETLNTAASQALITTTLPADRKLLLETISSTEAEIKEKVASIQALEMALKKDADNDLIPLLKHSGEQIQLAATIAVLNHGTRTGLDSLLQLLKSDSLKVRLAAARTLRLATGKQFGYLAYNTQETRNVKMTEWKIWLDKNAATVKLHVPLNLKSRTSSRTLVYFSSRSKVVEYDALGKQTWQLKIALPQCCTSMSNGHRLIGSDQKLQEYNSEGKLVWEMDGLPSVPTSCERLENGNTLLSFRLNKQIIEVSPARKIVWSVTLPSSPVDAKRLQNGLTVVCMETVNKLVQVDRQGKIIWEMKGLKRPRYVQVLNNDNFLLADAANGRAVEINQNKKVVWSKTGLQFPNWVRRLENGNTIISQQLRPGELIELDPSGKKVRTLGKFTQMFSRAVTRNANGK